MRWRTPRCGALAEGHANERMEARPGTWIRAVCREEEPALASPPRRVRPIGSHLTWSATLDSSSPGKGRWRTSPGTRRRGGTKVTERHAWT